MGRCADTFDRLNGWVVPVRYPFQHAIQRLGHAVVLRNQASAPSASTQSSRICFIAVAAAGTAAVLAAWGPTFAAAGLVVCAGVAFVLVVALRRGYLAVPVALALGVRFALVYINNNVFGLFQTYDARAFERRGVALSELPASELLGEFGTGARSVSWLAAWVYRALGPEPVITQLMMAVLGTALILAAVSLCRALGGTRSMELFVAWTLAVFPQPAMHSAILLREIPFSLFFLIGLIYFVRWSRGRQPVDAVLGTAATLAASVFHPAGLFLLFGVLAGALRGLVSPTSSAFRLAGIVGAVIIVLATWFVVESDFGADHFGADRLFEAQTFYTQEERPTVGGAAYPEWLRIRGPAELWKAPARYVTFMYSPFPWMIRTDRQLLGLVDALLFVVLSILVVRGYAFWRRAGRSQAFWLVSAVLIVGTFVFAMGTSNYGTAIRHRAKFSPALVVLASAGFVGMQRSRRPEGENAPSAEQGEGTGHDAGEQLRLHRVPNASGATSVFSLEIGTKDGPHTRRPTVRPKSASSAHLWASADEPWTPHSASGRTYVR